MQKRGISQIVVMILIVLLALVAVLIVWNVVSKQVAQTSSGIQFESLTLGLKINAAKSYVNETSGKADLWVKRTGGEAELVELKFVFSNDTSEYIVSHSSSLKVLEEEKYTLNYDNNITNIKKIAVAGVIKIAVNSLQTTGIKDILDLSKTSGGGGSQSQCGDGSCNNGEDCNSCPSDCGACINPNIIYVDSCRELNESNKIYLLNESIIPVVQTCFNITANNVTLDCNGKSIINQSLSVISPIGVYAESVNDTVVRNCNILLNSTLHYAKRGIYFKNVNFGLIENNIVGNPYVYGQDGIFIWYSSNNFLINNTAGPNHFNGIYLYLSPNNTLINNNVNSNNYAGISITESPNSILINNTANSNAEAGIFLHASNDSYWKDNIANSNKYGLYVSFSSNNTLINNTANSNSYYGVWNNGGPASLNLNNKIAGTKSCFNSIFDFRCSYTGSNSFSENLCDASKISGCSGLVCSPCPA